MKMATQHQTEREPSPIDPDRLTKPAARDQSHHIRAGLRGGEVMGYMDVEKAIKTAVDMDNITSNDRLVWFVLAHHSLGDRVKSGHT